MWPRITIASCYLQTKEMELKSVLFMSYHPGTPQLHCPPYVGSESFTSVPQPGPRDTSLIESWERDSTRETDRQRETNLLSRRFLPTSKTILFITFLTRVLSRVQVLKEQNWDRRMLIGKAKQPTKDTEIPECAPVQKNILHPWIERIVERTRCRLGLSFSWNEIGHNCVVKWHSRPECDGLRN